MKQKKTLARLVVAKSKEDAQNVASHFRRHHNGSARVFDRVIRVDGIDVQTWIVVHRSGFVDVPRESVSEWSFRETRKPGQLAGREYGS